MTDFLLDTGRLEFRRVDPGETIVAEGELAHDFYLIRLGTVRVFRTVRGRDEVLAKRGANDYFGAVALLATELPAAAGGRTASVAAVDPVEVVRVPGPVFREMCDRFPDLHAQLLAECADRLSDGPPVGVLNEYVGQGLFQAKRLLALDLTRCTRCDDARACADSHDGHSRLARASGSGSTDRHELPVVRHPYCMDGCRWTPSTARAGLEVRIEDHCIGCGLCERSCPTIDPDGGQVEGPGDGRCPAARGQLRPLQRRDAVLREGLPARGRIPHRRPDPPLRTDRRPRPAADLIPDSFHGGVK